MVIQIASKPKITWESLPADYVLPDDPVENEHQPLLAAALSDAKDMIRRSYTPHREGGMVSIVMEFLSDTDGGEFSVRSTPPYGKLYFYEQILQVPVYVTYDPYEQDLQVRGLQSDRYVIQPKDKHDRVWISEINLFLGVWAGTRLLTTTSWLRWWDKDENLLLWSTEKAELSGQRAEREYERAEALAAKLRELGIDLNP